MQRTNRKRMQLYEMKGSLSFL